MPKCITVGMVPTVSAALLLAGLPSGAEAASAARPSDALAGLVVSGPVEAVEPTELERPDAPSAMVTARATGQRVEDLSQRDELTRVFANPDGTWTAESATQPERVEDEAGEWHDIDTALVNKEAGLAPRYAATDVVLSPGGNRTFAALSEDGKNLAWRWPTTLPTPTVEGGTAIYPNVVPGGDLIVTALSTGFTHSLVLRERPDGPVDVTIPLATDGATLTETPQGGLVVETVAGDEVVTAPRPLMWDSSADAAGQPENVVAVNTSVGETPGGTPTVTFSPDEQFLSDPDTVYPVTVDPSFSTYATGDAWVQNSDYTSGQTASKELRAGTYDGGNHRARSFMHFDNADKRWDGKHILSAKLVLRNFDSGSCASGAIRASRIGEAWDGSRLTWGNQPSVSYVKDADYSAAKGYNANCEAGDAVWNITGMAQDWATGVANHGVRLRAVDETSNATWRKYRSSNYNDYPILEPHINVTYNSYPNQASAPSLSPVSSYAPPNGSAALYTSSTTPTLSAKASDPDGGTVRLRFEVHAGTASSTPLATCTTGYVAQGSTASCALATALPDNATHFVRVKAFDGTDWAGGSLDASGGWSTWTEFKAAASAPATPFISCPSPYTDASWSNASPTSNVTCTITATGSGTNAPGYILWSLNGGPETRAKIAQSSDPTVAKTTVSVPKQEGGYTISARAESPSGKTSEPASYRFGYGRLALSAPASGPVQTISDTVVVEASGPPTGSTAVPSATLQWRVASSGSGAATGWNTAPADLDVSNDGASGITVSGSWDASEVTRDDAQGIDLDPRAPVLLEVQVCVDYPSGDACSWTASPSQVLRVPHAFGSGFPVADVAAGQVALWTGEFTTGSTDVDVPGWTGSLSLSRTHVTFGGPAKGAAGVFGPGWTAHLDGPDFGAAGLLVSDDTLIDGTIALVDPAGEALVFAARRTPQRRSETAANLETGIYSPVDEHTALAGVKAEVTGTGDSTKLLFTDVDGTVTTFKTTTAPAPGIAAVFAPESVNEPGQAGKTTYSYDQDGRVTRILAPVPPGVDCSGALNPGCRALRLQYPTAGTATAANPAGQLKSVWFEAYNPSKSGGAGMDSIEVARYSYDSAKRLTAATDPRTSLTTRYGYDGTTTRLATITPPGLDPIRLSYDTADGSARLSRVTRDMSGSSAKTLATVVYRVPIDGTGGTPDVAGTAASWGQPPTAIPTHGSAVFSADQPTVNTDPSAISTEQWPYAWFWYTDDRGYTRNTAEFGAGEWLYTETDYDAHDNVVAHYGTGDIAAIRAGTSRQNAGSRYRYEPVTQTDANGTRSTTVPEGAVLTDAYGPAREAIVDGALQHVRPHTHINYDENAPNNGSNPATGQGYGLPTTTTVTASQADATADIGNPLEQIRTGYDPITSQTRDETWALGIPTTTTQVMGAGQADITTGTRYDSVGRIVETRQPKSNGTDAGTRRTVYYSAGTNDADGLCGDKPQWAGAVCVVDYAGHPATGPKMPVTRATGYDAYLSPLTVTESVAGTGKRTTRNVYDKSGRLSKTWTTSTLTDSPPAPGAAYTYDSATGLLNTVAATDDTGVLTGGKIETRYDSWGRPTTYTPAADETTTTSYDAAGRVAAIADPKGTTTFTYDGGTGNDANGELERRGLPTSISVSNPAGRTVTFTGAYDAAGTLTTQQLPGGLTQRLQTNLAGETTGLTYSGPVTNPDGTTNPNGAWLGWAQTSDALGRVSAEWTPTGAAFDGQLTSGAAAGYSRAYRYDRASRLIHVEDHTAPAGTGTVDTTDDALTAPSGTVCQTRDYAFDTNGNRTSLTRTGATADGGCGDTDSTTKTWTYDSADRLTGGYTYDDLGRQTTLPAADTPAGGAAGDVTLGYYNTDAIKSITQSGVTTAFTLDPLGRRATATVGATGAEATSTTTHHYSDDSDNPAWVGTTNNGNSSTTRYAESLTGDLTAALTDGAISLELGDPHGDIVTTVQVPTTGEVLGVDGWTDTDEYGNAQIAPGQAATSPGPKYRWLGAEQRDTTDAGLILMGARVYNPTSGAFTSVDTVYGGNTTAYTYPQDPVNQYDTTGLNRLACRACGGLGGSVGARDHGTGCFHCGYSGLSGGGYSSPIAQGKSANEPSGLDTTSANPRHTTRLEATAGESPTV